MIFGGKIDDYEKTYKAYNDLLRSYLDNDAYNNRLYSKGIEHIKKNPELMKDGKFTMDDVIKFYQSTQGYRPEPLVQTPEKIIAEKHYFYSM